MAFETGGGGGWRKVYIMLFQYEKAMKIKRPLASLVCGLLLINIFDLLLA